MTYGKSSHQAEALIGDAVARVVEYARRVGKPVVIERLDFRKKKAVLEGESRRYSRMLSSFSYAKTQACFLSRGHREGVGIHQVNPAFSSVVGRVKFMERYGLSVSPGCGFGAGPSSARVFRAHSAPMGVSCRQWRSGRLHRTREEASEARVDVLGCDSGAVETGACSATPAGEAETRDPIRFGLSCGWRLAGRLEQGPVRCSRVRFPGGAALNCWGGGAAQAALSWNGWRQCVTKVNHFYNGPQRRNAEVMLVETVRRWRDLVVDLLPESAADLQRIVEAGLERPEPPPRKDG